MLVTQKTPGDWLRLIEAEFLEMPGLHLTRPQVQRLWGLEPRVCDALLEALISANVLRKTDHGTFALSADDRRR
jgi:hypothetical protein